MGMDCDSDNTVLLDEYQKTEPKLPQRSTAECRESKLVPYSSSSTSSSPNCSASTSFDLQESPSRMINHIDDR